MKSNNTYLETALGGKHIQVIDRSKILHASKECLSILGVQVVHLVLLTKNLVSATWRIRGNSDRVLYQVLGICGPAVQLFSSSGKLVELGTRASGLLSTPSDDRGFIIPMEIH